MKNIKFKILIFQLFAKILLKQRSLNQSRHCLTGIIQISIIFFDQKILIKYFNDFDNKNLSVLWLKWTQTMKIKKNQTSFHGSYLNLTSFFIGRKVLKCFNDWNFSIHYKSEHKQINWNKIKGNMCKSDSIVPYLQSRTLFKWLYFLITFNSKMNNNSSRRKIFSVYLIPWVLMEIWQI